MTNPNNPHKFRFGLYNLRYSDPGTPGNTILEWKGRYFTNPGGTARKGGVDEHGQVYAWDPVDGRNRTVRHSMHHSHAGITGHPSKRQHDRLWSDVAELRNAGKPYIHLCFRPLPPIKAVFIPAYQYHAQRVMTLEVELVGVRKHGL